jgi:hypothetical protein
MTVAPRDRLLPQPRVPRVLPTPPRPPAAEEPYHRGLHRIVYEEVLFILQRQGMNEMSATATALCVARKVVERA